jgi:hypothetical protein
MPAQKGGHRQMLWARAAVTPARLIRGRFTGLTVLLLTVLFCASIIERRDLRELIVSIGFSVLVLFAVWTAGRRLRIVTAMLALPTAVGHWALQLSGLPGLRAIVFGITTVFLAFLTLVILCTVFGDQAVTADTIVGAVCAYFLIGMTWGSGYALLSAVSPGAFSVSPALLGEVRSGLATSPLQPLLQYYSFTTLATLGYGDITPLSPAARTISVFEGMTGQLYLAVMIARLVGLHTARSNR